MAEFAPSAQKAIEAPPTTSGPSAASGGGGGRRSTATTAPPEVTATTVDPGGETSPTTRVSRARPCVGSPPRQTDDPMSPPCMATIFEGDNGGATHTGVSATEIRVGIPNLTASATSYYSMTVDALFEHFNQRFELYGRRLVPVYVSGSTNTALSARAVGAEVAATGVFAAATAYSEWQTGQAALPAELARRGIVTVVRGGSTWWTDRTLYDENDPYIWSVYPSSEDMQRNLTDFACRTLAGRPVAHAGDAGLQGSARKFGIVVASQESAANSTILVNGLRECTGDTPAKVEWVSTSGANLDSAMSRLESDGATTLICVCESYFQWSAVSATHRVGYHPEWVLTPSYYGTGNDERDTQSNRANGNMAPPMRLSAGPKMLPVQARPWFRAVEPVFASAGTSISAVLSMGEFFYPQLLMLASGIQGAGPDLNPQSFGAALMNMQFPNPGAGQAPYWQPSAGFGPGDHSFYDDYHVSWWSDEAAALDIGYSSRPLGSWCYLDQGARFRPGGYPADGESRMFTSAVTCR